MADVVAKAEPEVIVHQLSALSGPVKMGNVKRMAAATNRLRSEGTDHLLAAGRGQRRQVRGAERLRLDGTHRWAGR